MVLTRLLPNGDLDPGFGRRGVVRPPVPSNVEVTALARARGGIFVAGSQQRRGKATATVLRYHPDGHLDRDFGNGGMLRVAARGNYRTAHEDVDLLCTPGRLILVRPGVPRSVSAFRLDGTPVSGYGAGVSAEQKEGLVATLQGDRTILAWTSRSAREKRVTTGLVERLSSP